MARILGMPLQSIRYRLPACLFLRPASVSRLLRLLVITLIFVAGYYVYRQKMEPRISQEYLHLMSLRSLPVQSDCRIPKLDPWDPIVMPYYSKPEPLSCSPMQKQAVTLKDGVLTFNKTLLEDAECYLTPFWHNQDVSDFEIVYGNRSSINWTLQDGYKMTVEDEFFEVRCVANGVFSSRDLFAKNFAQIRVTNVTRNFTDVPSRPVEPVSLQRPGVILIGLDSMSRQNFLRQLPLTHSRLRKMDFIDMEGHVKIADNTFGNVVAYLMGRRGTSTSEFAAEIDEDWEIAFDDYEMIWRDFSRNGYATLFAEDRPDIGTFNYMRQLCGFLKQPVDHYLRPFWLATFWSILSRRSKQFCYDEKPMHRIHLDYLEDFLKAYEERRQFAFWWTQDMTHDYLNLAGRMDDDLEAFLERNERRFEKSIVMVLSDHGNRYDRIRETINGRLEARLPFLAIRLPPALKEQYPFLEKQLKLNSNRMTTPFDVHETLLDIVRGTFTTPKPARDAKARQARGISLFDTISPQRTCYQAAIPQDYCPCYNEKEIDLDEAKKAAEVLLGRVNELVGNAQEVERSESSRVEEFVCAALSLERIQYASIRLPPETLVIDPHVDNTVAKTGIQVHYRVVFVVKPSGAILEGTAVRDFGTGGWFTTNEFERNNAYGNSSSCVTDPVLRKLCYCQPKPTTAPPAAIL